MKTQKKLVKKGVKKFVRGGHLGKIDKKTILQHQNEKDKVVERLAIATGLADEMIKIACEYARKWGKTSGVGFITMYNKRTGITVLDEDQLKEFFEKQKENLVECIRNGGHADTTKGVIRKKQFDLDAGDFEDIVFDIFIRTMVRLGIAVASTNEMGESVLNKVFRRRVNFRNGTPAIITTKRGGISSNIVDIARISPTILKPAYMQYVDGWRKMFKVLDEAADLPETKKGKLSGLFEDKDENVDADISTSASKYTPPETEVKKEIEDTAIKIAKRYYRNKGYDVKSVENENCGWDLTIRRDGKELHIEVKGTSRKDYHFFLSKNEYDRMISDPKWRLFVAKNVLEDPDPDRIVKRRQNVEKLFDLNPFCFEGIWKDE